MAQVQQQQPATLRVVRGSDVRFLPIPNGKAGSYRTAKEMAHLVREAAVKDIGLETFAAQILRSNNLDSHSDPDETIDAIFQYVQKITYISDTTGTGSFDAIQTARDTIERGAGDCDDLSILLATLLALVGFRPAFVMAKMNEGSTGFDHIYVEVVASNHRIALDPTSKKFGMGWESPRILEKVVVPIFPRGNGGLGDNSALIQGGIQAGTQIVGGLLTPKPPSAHSISIQLGQSFDITDKAVAAFLTTLSAKPILAPEEYAGAQDAVAALEAAANREMAQDTTGYVRRQWAMEMPGYVAWLQTLAGKVSVSPLAGDTTGGAALGTLGSVSSSLPVLLLIGGAALFLLAKR